MDGNDTKRLAVSVEDASAALGISRSRAYEVIRRGELRAIRLGGRLLVPWTELVRVVEGPAGDPDE